MRQVFRWEIPVGDVKGSGDGTFTLKLPIGAIPLHVDVQQRAPHMPSMWILCDDEEERTTQRRFLFAGTGAQGSEPPAAKSEYIGTFQDGGFVWHIFEVPGKETA